MFLGMRCHLWLTLCAPPRALCAGSCGGTGHTSSHPPDTRLCGKGQAEASGLGFDFAAKTPLALTPEMGKWGAPASAELQYSFWMVDAGTPVLDLRFCSPPLLSSCPDFCSVPLHNSLFAQPGLKYLGDEWLEKGLGE